jgi:hypothetical protein
MPRLTGTEWDAIHCNWERTSEQLAKQHKERWMRTVVLHTITEPQKRAVLQEHFGRTAIHDPLQLRAVYQFIIAKF